MTKEDHFTKPFSLNEDLAAEFKNISVPGDLNKKRGLIQPTVTKAAERTTSDDVHVKLDFELSWGIIHGIRYQAMHIIMSEKGLRFEDRQRNFLATIRWNEINHLKVSHQPSMLIVDEVA